MHSTALYDDHGRFLGHSTEVKHHTTGDRAWCLEGMNEWCYPSLPCDSCQRARMGDPWEIIQRVRELCDAREEEENDNGGYGKAALVPIRDIRRALDDNKGVNND